MEGRWLNVCLFYITLESMGRALHEITQITWGKYPMNPPCFLHLASQNITLQHKLDNFLFAYRNAPTVLLQRARPRQNWFFFLSWMPRTKLTLLKPNLQEIIQDKTRKQKRQQIDYGTIDSETSVYNILSNLYIVVVLQNTDSLRHFSSTPFSTSSFELIY